MSEVVCPRDHLPLKEADGALVCPDQHRYPIVEGVGVLLVDEDEPTHAACHVPPEKQLPHPESEGIDQDVQELVRATCGNLYQHLVGNLTSYPIPEVRLPPGEGRTLLDVGCNWGRWTIAAANRGYVATGVDPSLRGIVAASRVASQLGVEAQFVLGDARHLPFPDDSFDVVFSYGVYQHFTKKAVQTSFDEVGRVLKPGGTAMVQLANVWGARSLMNQARERRFREPRHIFDVRYWGPHELRDELARRVGPTELVADGFITLNPQPADLHLFPRRYRAIVHVSEALRKASDRVPPLVNAADSLYAISRSAR
jgi:SAM-dependent methyltransferase/uncharacterized protein YbaR (Trm112 family)